MHDAIAKVFSCCKRCKHSNSEERGMNVFKHFGEKPRLTIAQTVIYTSLFFCALINVGQKKSNVVKPQLGDVFATQVVKVVYAF